MIDQNPANNEQLHTSEIQLGGERQGGLAVIDATSLFAHGPNQSTQLLVGDNPVDLMATVTVGDTVLGALRTAEQGNEQGYAVAALSGDESAGYALATADDGKHVFSRLTPGGKVAIGRNLNDSIPGALQLVTGSNDMKVSSTHAAIELNPDGSITVEDLESTQGSTIKGSNVVDKTEKVTSASAETEGRSDAATNIGETVVGKVIGKLPKSAEAVAEKYKDLEVIYNDIGIATFRNLTEAMHEGPARLRQVEDDLFDRFATESLGVVAGEESLEHMLRAAIAEGSTRTPDAAFENRPLTSILTAMDDITPRLKDRIINMLDHKAHTLGSLSNSPNVGEVEDLNRVLGRMGQGITEKLAYDDLSDSDRKVIALLGIVGLAASAESNMRHNTDEVDFLLGNLAKTI